jgi:ATP-dependent DNA helicase HFM1/MER3
MAKQRVTGPKNDDHVSKMKKMSTSQAGKKDPSREESVLSERDKNLPSYTKKREKTSTKPLYSDYGDEVFDDLPSPSRLLGNRGSGFATSVSPVVNNQTKSNITDVAVKKTKKTKNRDPEPSPSASLPNLAQKERTKPSISKPQHEIIEIPDDTPPDSTELPLAIEKGSPVKQSTLPLPERADQPPNLKRKASQDETRTEELKKRAKQSPFVSALKAHPSDLLNNEQPLGSEQPASPVSSASPVSPAAVSPMLAGRMDLTAKWDDGIDLLDEFKDIIKFI